MTKNFILTFGGTGARCAEALCYLSAAGIVRDPLHLLVIDPDQSNGNVDQVRNQLGRYIKLQSHIDRSAENADPFFSTELNGEAADSYFWQYPNANQPFATLLQYAAHPAEYKACLDLLYDDDDLALSFERGYIGRAHVGSLDLLRTLGRAIQAAADSGDQDRDPMLLFFRRLRAAAQAPTGARLVVCGSIFGGTGASGLPAIPPLLSQHLQEGLRERIRIGCVQMAPYFSFPPGSTTDPDSALHPLATQAALYHYAFTNVGYERVYLVGAPNVTATNEANWLGGAGQRNRAHYAELGAAFAMADYLSMAAPPAGSEAEMRTSGATEVSWEQLPHSNALEARKLLTSFATFCYMHVHFLHDQLRQRHHVGARWADALASEAERQLGGQEPELKDLHDFGQRFLQWARETQAGPGVRLLEVPTEAIEGGLASLGAGGPDDPGEVEAYHELVSELCRVRRVRQGSPVGWYVAALTRATKQFCERNYSAWWK